MSQQELDRTKKEMTQEMFVINPRNCPSNLLNSNKTDKKDE